jgi:hypothetical protein
LLLEPHAIAAGLRRSTAIVCSDIDSSVPFQGSAIQVGNWRNKPVR